MLAQTILIAGMLSNSAQFGQALATGLETLTASVRQEQLFQAWQRAQPAPTSPALIRRSARCAATLR